MTALRRSGAPQQAALLALCALAGAAALGAGTQLLDLDPQEIILVVAAAVALPAVVYLLWNTHPAFIFTAAFVLSPFSNNWEGLGIPGAVAPDRLLLLAAIAAVAIRTPPIRDRPPLRLGLVHAVMAVALLYAFISAGFAGTLTEREPFFRLFDAYGVLPFLTFTFAPLAFTTPAHRRALATAIVALGAYLGLTALFEAANLDSLVVPRYILDPSFGIHADYARGPFVEASTNGLGLFVCAAGAIVCALTVRARSVRVAATVIAPICLVASFFTLERSVWLGVSLGVIATLLVLPQARRAVVPVILTAVIGLGTLLALSPSVADQANDRLGSSETRYDRLNMNKAAINMVEEKPLQGFGWARYADQHYTYFEQGDDYPLTAENITLVHNVFLNNAAELGLLGTGIWVLALALMLVGALLPKPRAPDLRVWRAMLIPVALVTFVVLSFTPIKNFGILLLCLWAAVVWSVHYADDRAPATTS